MIFFTASFAFYCFLIVATLIAISRVNTGQQLVGSPLFAFKMRERLKKGSPARLYSVIWVFAFPAVFMFFMIPAPLFVLWVLAAGAYLGLLTYFSKVCNRHQVGFIATPAVQPDVVEPATPAQNPYARNTSATRLQMLGGHVTQVPAEKNPPELP